VSGFYLAHFLAALLPLTAGLLLYGWRGAAVVAAVAGSAAAAVAAWGDIGPRGRTLHWSQCMWLALLLGLMLPAHLAARPAAGAVPAWPLLAARAELVQQARVPISDVRFASGLEVPSRTAADIQGIVADIRLRTQPGEPIFVYPTSPLLYALAVAMKTYPIFIMPWLLVRAPSRRGRPQASPPY